MGAISFVESYKNYVIEVIVTTIVWFLVIAAVSAIAVALTRGLQMLSTRVGNLTIGLGVLIISFLCAVLHIERFLLALVRKFLFGH